MFKAKVNPPSTKEVELKTQAESVLQRQNELEALESKLMQNDQFKAFIVAQKAAQKEIAETWQSIETEMIKHGIKSIKGDFGSLTIAVRSNWEVDMDKLPVFFTRVVPDTTKISEAYKLTGVSPKGAKRTITKYLLKRIK